MLEHLAPVTYYLEVHLLCASLVCLGAWLLSSLRTVSASTKYWIWLLASLNFALPIGGLIDRFGAAEITGASQLNLLAAGALGIARHGALAAILAGVWLLGAATMLIRLGARIHTGGDAGAGAEAARREITLRGVAVHFSRAHRGPLVEGLICPRICLPVDIEQLLTPQEFAAVLRHELTHARRRDNLLQLGHELVLCLLWFHPLLWVSGARLALYRELSCDDAAMRAAPGAHLIAALAKLASPERSSLLRAAAASQVGPRVQRLLRPRPVSAALNALTVTVFALLLLGGIGLTIAHTACCLVPQP